jgi:hypothetical protein
MLFRLVVENDRQRDSSTREMKLPKINQHKLAFVAIASLIFASGVLVYVFDRLPQHIYFLSGVLDHPLSKNPMFGLIGWSLPSFAHVYAFIIFTVIFFPPTQKVYITITLFWLTIDCAFEFAQRPDIAKVVATEVPDWFRRRNMDMDRWL